MPIEITELTWTKVTCFDHNREVVFNQGTTGGFRKLPEKAKRLLKLIQIINIFFLEIHVLKTQLNQVLMNNNKQNKTWILSQN